MTPKEKIYAKIIDVKNEGRIILGLKPIDKERDLAMGFARNHTIKELEEDLALAQESLAATKKKAAIEAYFKSPDGIALKRRLEKKIDDARGMLLKAQSDMAIDLRDFTMKHLGYRWIIRNFNDTCLSLEFNDKDGKPKFGMSINVYYGTELGDPDEFSMNYSSGCFDMKTISERHEYLSGLCTLTKQDVAAEFKKMLKAYSRFCNEYHTEIDNLRNQLQNPPING
ncbi:MAG: hypothetical protein HDR88_10300 [Bacteroides sp.]|nr:hypothetical protein [Bacteroides sp.]